MPDAKPANKRLTQEQKDRILYLANQGMPTKEIAAEMVLPVMKVHGYVQSCINMGKLNPDVARPGRAAALAATYPSEASFMAPAADPVLPPAQETAEPMPPPPPPPPLPPQVQMAPQPRPVPPPAPRVVQAPTVAPRQFNDGFQGGRTTAGYNNGWNNPQMAVRYQVERKVPYDGIVGQHNDPFTETDLCQMYGEGLYRVLRYEPGRPVPTEFDVKVASNFGPPKYPKQGVSAGEGRPGNRPSWNQNRWDRDRQGEEGEEARRPSGYDRPLGYYERHAPPPAQSDASAAVASSAIDALSKANERALNQAERAREGGPESFLSNFMQSQQQLANDRFERERIQIEERRKEDRQQSEDRRKEEQERWERRQREKEEDHKKELERIRMDGEAKAKVAREEREMIMALEDKKLEVIRQEHKVRQDQMSEELRLSREQAKLNAERLEKQMAEVKDKTDEQIDSMRDTVKADVDREKTQLDREFELRKSGMETEQKLQEKILEVRQEQLQQQGGNEVFNTINTLIKEFSKGLEKVVELKKVQSSSPEAQVAMVAAGATQAASAPDGNVKPEVEVRPAAQPEAQGGNVNMEKLVQDMMDQPFFRDVMKEWALHVEEKADPTTFANMYLEWMRDPNSPESRQACSMFCSVMKVRGWKKMLAILEPKLPADIVAAFKQPFATDFYDGFKEMVLEQIRAYWQGFMEEQQEKKGGKGGNGQSPAVHAGPAPVAPKPAAAAQGPQAINEEEDEIAVEPEPSELSPPPPPPGPPLPTREALRTRSVS